jgi:UDP-3-O-[3-hydroxymyristoyl] glucosamine N-acyltransferase
VKNQHKTFGNEKLDKISWLENGEKIDDKSRIVRLTHISVHTSCDNAVRITGSPKSGSTVFV